MYDAFTVGLDAVGCSLCSIKCVLKVYVPLENICFDYSHFWYEWDLSNGLDVQSVSQSVSESVTLLTFCQIRDRRHVSLRESLSLAVLFRFNLVALLRRNNILIDVLFCFQTYENRNGKREEKRSLSGI